jgi:hypothetical protein
MADERISVVLEADAKQLTAEFARARRSAEDFGAKTLPLVEQNLNSAWVQTGRLGKGLRDLHKPVRGTGQGMLQLAQFADDAQYGLRGVMNNIPGLVMGLGAGAGLAGVLSLAVIAGAKLVPILQDIYGDGEIQKINQVTEAIARRYEVEISKLREVQREREVRGEIAVLLREASLYAQQELRVQDQRLGMLEDQRRALELQRRLQDELDTARGLTTATSTADTRVSRLQEDLANARREAEIANAEYDRIATAGGNMDATLRPRLEQALREIERLQQNIASGTASVEGAQEGIKNGVAGSRSALGFAERKLAKDKEQLKVQQELARQTEEQLSAAAGQGRAVLSTLSARIDGLARERAELEKQIPVYQEIARLAMERAKADAAAGPAQDAHVKAWRTEEERLNAEKEARRKQQAEARNRAIDANILRGVPGAAANVAGRTGEDVELERKRQIAIERVTALQRLERGRRIRRSTGIEVGEGRGVSRLEGPRGLGPETRRRFNERDRPGPVDSLAGMLAKQFAQALNNDEELLRMFRQLGVWR